MREIIFRAWDGKKLSIGKAEYFDDTVNFRFDHFDIDCDKPVLEQYTGLKDRNGKMIFEGDILKGFEGYPVTYSGDTGEGLGMAVGWYLQNNDFESWVSFESKEDWEVIGNIHEGEQTK